MNYDAIKGVFPFAYNFDYGVRWNVYRTAQDYWGCDDRKKCDERVVRTIIYLFDCSVENGLQSFVEKVAGVYSTKTSQLGKIRDIVLSHAMELRPVIGRDQDDKNALDIFARNLGQTFDIISKELDKVCCLILFVTNTYRLHSTCFRFEKF